MFYIFAILVCLMRISSSLVMIVNYIMGQTMHSYLLVVLDCLTMCSMAIVGLCLVVLMFQLFTYLQWNLITLEFEANRQQAQQNADEAQQ